MWFVKTRERTCGDNRSSDPKVKKSKSNRIHSQSWQYSADETEF